MAWFLVNIFAITGPIDVKLKLAQFKSCSCQWELNRVKKIFHYSFCKSHRDNC